MPTRKLELNEETLSVIEEIGGHMPGGFFIYEAKEPETLIYANKAVLQIYGCSDLEEFRELTGYTFKGMVHPEDYNSISESIVRQIDASENKMDYAEYRITRKDGSIRWVDDYGHYAETAAYGGIYVVFISDITEKRNKREEDAATSEAVISTLVNSYNTVWLINDVATQRCSLFHTDMDGSHTEAIENALSHARYTDAKTEYVATMVAPEDRERMQEQTSLPYILKQFESKSQFSVNYIRALESGPRHYRIDFGKVHMPGGRLGVMMGFKDVDEEVRQDRAMQEALAEAKKAELENKLALQEHIQAQEKHQKELDSMITAMASDYRSVYHVDIDTDEAVCYRSDPSDPKQMPEGVHFPYYERFKQYCDLYVDPEFQAGFMRFIDPDNVRAELATENIIAYRYLAHRNGQDYYEMLRMAGVRHPNDRDDHIVHAVGVGFTVIDAEMRETMARNHALRDALVAAENANKAKTAFLSNMSHEIRTPMNAIIGLNNIAMNEPSASEKVKEYLDKIGTSAHHLLGIINDILDMSRIESGRIIIKNEEFSFAKALEQVNTMISGQCRDKGLVFDCHINGHVDDYYIGDDMKLRQVMINILGNAVKFTPEGGTVSFSVEETAHFDGKTTLCLTVSDTGIGMSKEYLPRLFDPFSQEDSSSTSKYGSTGLGMPITKSIVELMNGNIEVESEKGKGTTFIVTVTLINSDRKTAEETGEEGAPQPHEMSVLVIDDDPIACEHARIVLGQVGISCESATSGLEGLKMAELRHARRDPYNLILVDWRMPDIDGVETTRLIRASVGSETPIIILTSYSWEDIADEATEAGVDTFVAKPLFAGSVMDEFRNAFKKKNAGSGEASTELEGRRILLAEDMPVNAEIIMMVLSMREMEVDLAENGKVAVDMFTTHEAGYYDAVLMDMRMPVMDGLEATRTIRATDRPDAKRIPIIALTANAFDEDVQRSMQTGLNAHLSKPVEPDALFKTLENLIRA